MIWAPKIPGGHVKGYFRAKNPFYPFNWHIKAVYECDEGYTLEDVQYNKLHCQKRMWVGKRPRCIRTDNRKQPCLINKGGCHHLCSFAGNRMYCECRPGYILNSDGKSCQIHHPWSTYGGVQGDDSRERKNPCLINNGGCNQHCSNINDNAVCYCIRGFNLSSDGKRCVDIDECLVDNGGCEGQCQNYVGSHVCRCPSGYKTAADRKSCQDENECLRNNGHGPCTDKCTNTKGSYECSCTIPGTILGPDKKTCEDINECEENNFGCSHICTNYYSSAFCSCPIGHQMADDYKTCTDINECELEEFANKCKGRCINEIGTYRCGDEQELKEASTPSPVCPPGHHIGDNGRCEDIDECANNSFGCSHNCNNIIGSAYCSCPRGYQLSDNGKNCLDIDECQNPSSHRCRQVCKNTVGSYHCLCNEGYKLISDGMCEDINECESNSLDCSHICKNVEGSAHCACPVGYELSDNKRDCIAIDECKNNSLGCSYKCQIVAGTAHCVCPSGYKLSNNKKDCVDVDECRDRHVHRCHHECVNTVGSFKCVCAEGYNLRSDGYCEDIDECKNNAFGCSHVCQNVPGSVYCACPAGYRLGPNKKDCLDIDECAKESTHKCNHKCVNTVGSFNCDCYSGYIMTRDGKCEGCQKDSYRSKDDDVCMNCPEYSHTIGNGVSSRSDCICQDGFVGNLTIDDYCTDIDECEVENGGCSDTCLNTPGSFICICPQGYVLDRDEKTCVDRDECSVNKGGCHQGCINTVGSFSCTCGEGYVVSESDRYTCADIDECSKNNGGCSHNCVNHIGGFYCTCKNGYRLSSDFRSCVEITCNRLPSPHNGKIDCTSPGTKEKLPLNTTCQITCKEGYMATGAAELKCGLNGDWSKAMPSCVSLSCSPIEKPEYGDVHPQACLTGTVGVLEKCTFTCNAGYRIVGKVTTRCQKDLTWRPREMPKCEKNILKPFIQCPSDITVVLKPHQSSQHVRIPEPKSNMDPKHIEIYPKFVESLEANFPAGVTDIHFIAKHPSNNLTANCRLRVNVEDKEPPTVTGCPGDISLYANSLEPVEVIWDEPLFQDNVGLESVTKTQSSGDRFNAGVHIVHYTAVDTSRNIATCVFRVSVLRKECGEPRDLLHGEKNCMDLLTSRICEPVCDPGYAFFGNVSEFYMCGPDGIWKPSKDIPDCSPSVNEPQEGCLPGTEFREEIDTDYRICVACLQGMYWDAQTSVCAPCPVGSYQDEYGQLSCKPCTQAEVSNPLCKEST